MDYGCSASWALLILAGNVWKDFARTAVAGPRRAMRHVERRYAGPPVP